MMKFSYMVAAVVFGAGCSTAPVPAPESKPAESQGVGSVVRLDPALDTIVPPDRKIEKIAGGFEFTEGPLSRPDGSVWFSDVVGNVVRQWSPDGMVVEILRPGGYDQADAVPGSFIGPNGMCADKEGAVLLCQHGNRRIVRIGNSRQITTVVERYEGKRLNSPNDLVYRSDGSLYEEHHKAISHLDNDRTFDPPDLCKGEEYRVCSDRRPPPQQRLHSYSSES